MTVTELQAKLKTAHEDIFAMGRLTNEQLDALPLGALILYPEEPPYAQLVCLKIGVDGGHLDWDVVFSSETDGRESQSRFHRYPIRIA
jgi:hypothetical protein